MRFGELSPKQVVSATVPLRTINDKPEGDGVLTGKAATKYANACWIVVMQDVFLPYKIFGGRMPPLRIVFSVAGCPLLRYCICGDRMPAVRD